MSKHLAKKNNRTPAVEAEFTEVRAARSGGAMRAVGRVLAFVLATLILLVGGALGVVYVLTRGPSPTARELFVMSVRETSAVGFLAGIFVSDEEIADIEAGNAEDTAPGTTDASMISIPSPGADGEELSEGNGIVIEDVSGPSYQGKLMIISDPSRIFVGVPDSFGGRGLTLREMIEKTGAIGGVNGGGFEDENGTGKGGTPEGIVILEGELYSGLSGRHPTAVIDYDGVLHVGDMTGAEAMELNARWAISFGPVLVVNGEECEGLVSGVNPRTAIGQRADGAILLLVIDGRQVDSLGATCGDLAELMIEKGAVNALNLDGGSSTMMIYNGEELNTCASVIGPRMLPTAILVR